MKFLLENSQEEFTIHEYQLEDEKEKRLFYDEYLNEENNQNINEEIERVQ
jgi:hypothetical protein